MAGDGEQMRAMVMDDCADKMHKAVTHLQSEFAAVRTGRSKRGPTPSLTVKPRPIACGTTRISENKMEASSGKRSMGCKVTSQASSGVVHIVMKLPARLRVARYSGK